MGLTTTNPHTIAEEHSSKNNNAYISGFSTLLIYHFHKSCPFSTLGGIPPTTPLDPTHHPHVVYSWPFQSHTKSPPLPPSPSLSSKVLYFIATQPWLSHPLSAAADAPPSPPPI